MPSKPNGNKNPYFPSGTTDGEARCGHHCERRGFPRHETWQQVEILDGNNTINGELLDLSNSGARIRVCLGFMPESGKAVKMRLIDGTEISGLVTWEGDDRFGLNFELNLLDAEDYLHYDHLGYDYFRATLRQLKRRRKEAC